MKSNYKSIGELVERINERNRDGSITTPVSYTHLPYTQSMIDHHRGSIISTMLLATSDRKGRFSLRSRDSFLFGMAPLPYFTGIIPYAIEGELSLDVYKRQTQPLVITIRSIV